MRIMFFENVEDLTISLLLIDRTEILKDKDYKLIKHQIFWLKRWQKNYWRNQERMNITIFSKLF